MTDSDPYSVEILKANLQLAKKQRRERIGEIAVLKKEVSDLNRVINDLESDIRRLEGTQSDA